MPLEDNVPAELRAAAAVPAGDDVPAEPRAGAAVPATAGGRSEATRRATPAVRERIQRLAEQPDPARVLKVLPAESSLIGTERLVRSGPTVEIIHGHELDDIEWAVEVSYEGTYELDEDVLADGSKLDEHFSSMGGWIASTLVRLGDLTFEFRPPDLTAD